jgi:hypothetical protein
MIYRFSLIITPHDERSVALHSVRDSLRRQTHAGSPMQINLRAWHRAHHLPQPRQPQLLQLQLPPPAGRAYVSVAGRRPLSKT